MSEPAGPRPGARPRLAGRRGPGGPARGGSRLDGARSDGAEASQVAVSVIPEGGEVASSGNPWVLLLRTFAQNKLAIIGVVVIVLVVLFSFIGPLL